MQEEQSFVNTENQIYKAGTDPTITMDHCVNEKVDCKDACLATKS